MKTAYVTFFNNDNFLLYRLQLYHVRYLYKSMTINFNIHNTTQYCTSVKGRNKPVSKVSSK